MAFVGGKMRIIWRLMLWAGCAMLTPGAAQAGWLQAKGDHFIIYGDASEAKLRTFAEKLEKFDFLLRRVTGVEDSRPASPVHVYLLRDAGEVKSVAHNPNAAGVYSTSDRFAYAALLDNAKDNQFDLGTEEILFHEYTHHFMLHYFPAAYPAWYVEGFAEFFSVVKFPRDGSVEFGHIPMYRAPGLVLASPYPLKDLLTRTTDGMKAGEGDRYYGTAWLLTHYFQYNDARKQEFTKYLNDLARGVPDVKPDSYFTGGIDGLEKDMRIYMRHRLSVSRLAAGVVRIGPITISAVDRAQGLLIEDELRLISHPRTEDLPALIADIRRVSAQYPANAPALALLAEAERRGDQPDAALADADRAIAIDPKLSRAYSTRGALLLERAQESDKEEDWIAARTAIVRANRADMDDPVPLALYYRYHAMRGGRMPEVAYDGLYKAYSLLPQNPEYRVTLAQALGAKGDYATASRLLDPLAYSPHASDDREQAIRLKAQFDAAAKEKGMAAASAAP